MKILIVSPFFPPESTVAIIRISSLVRELIRQGHKITIIRNEYSKSIEERYKQNGEFRNLTTYKVKIDQNTRFFEASNRYKEIFRKVMNVQKFDIVLITAGPFYTIPLCKISKKEYKTKCIIDFRDLWVFDIRKKSELLKPYNLIKKLIYFPIEKNSIKNADLVITVTEDWASILKKVYRTNKIKVIENGYDDYLLSKLQKKTYPYKDKFVITIFGKLSYYSLEYGEKFFRAMKELSLKYHDLLILHIGLPEKETDKAIKITGFDNKKYINTGFLNYTEGINLLQEASVNVIIDIRKGAMGTKFYDYIYVNKPLIYLGEKNTKLDELVKKFENGFTCYNEFDLINSINYIKENNIKNLTNNIHQKDSFSRAKQNKKYIDLMLEIL